MFNYGLRTLLTMKDSLTENFYESESFKTGNITTMDARDIRIVVDFWITDPPYADAVNYHELSDFFLVWHDLVIRQHFPE